MTLTRADVVAYLDGLGTHELGELIDELQARLGLPPPRVGFVTMGTSRTMGVPIDEPELEVVLIGFAVERKLELLRTIREVRPMPLSETVALLGQLPVTFAKDLSREQARTIAARLRSAGGQVEIR